jgi:hypothetical protein
MALCPLIQKDCIQEACEWYAGGIRKCSLVALAVLGERIHDISVFAYDKYIKEPGQE